MARPASGQVITNADGSRSARVGVADGADGRPSFKMPHVKTAEAAEERTDLLGRLAASLRRAVRPLSRADTETLLRYVAEARTEHGLAEAGAACEDIIAGVVPTAGSALAPSAGA